MLPASAASAGVYGSNFADAPKDANVRVPVVVFLHGFSRLSLRPIVEWQLWLASLGEGCLQILAADGFRNFASDWFCLPAIVLVGTVPAIAMAVMLRRGAPLTPKITTGLGGLAAAGLGNFGLRLFHPQDSSLMILVWQMGSVLLLTFLCGVAGRFLLRWRLVNSRTTAA